MNTDKRKEIPGLSPTNSKREYQYRPGLLNYEKLNHTQNELKVKLHRLRSLIKKEENAKNTS